MEIPIILAKGFFILFSVLENFTEKHSFVDDPCIIVIYCTGFKKLIQEVYWGFLCEYHTSSSNWLLEIKIRELLVLSWKKLKLVLSWKKLESNARFFKTNNRFKCVYEQKP